MHTPRPHSCVWLEVWVSSRFCAVPLLCPWSEERSLGAPMADPHSDRSLEDFIDPNLPSFGSSQPTTRQPTGPHSPSHNTTQGAPAGALDQRPAVSASTLGQGHRSVNSSTNLNQPQNPNPTSIVTKLAKLAPTSTNLKNDAVPAARCAPTWQWNVPSPPNLAQPRPNLDRSSRGHSRPLSSTYRCNEWTDRDPVRRPTLA